MNFHDVELLQNAMQNMGESAIRRKQLTQQQQMEMQRLSLEAQMRDIEQSRYNMGQARYEKMTELEQERGNLEQKRMDEIEKKYGVQDALKTLDSARQDLTSGLQGLATDTGLTPEQKSAYFKSSVDSIGDDNIKKQLLVNPQFSAIYNGQANWDNIANQVKTQQAGGGGRPGAIQQQIQEWRDAQNKATKSGDPDDQAYADKLAQNLPSALKTTAPAVAPKPMEVKNIQYDEMGKPTNSVTSFRLPGQAPNVPAPMATPPAAHIQYLQMHPEAAADFDAKYGQGASQQYLKTPQQPIPGAGGFPIAPPVLQGSSQ